MNFESDYLAIEATAGVEVVGEVADDVGTRRGHLSILIRLAGRTLLG